jgi:hypothetical protein
MTIKCNSLLGITLALIAAPALAHHAFAAVFNADDAFKVTGTITKIEWMNPHTWFYVEVQGADGQVDKWALEMGSPNGLVRRGWSRHTLQIGQQLTVSGYRAKDGRFMGSVKSVVLPDGQEFSGASSRGRD